MSTRTPKAVVAEARALAAQGLSPVAIAFRLNLSDLDRIKRWTDPEFAKAEKKKFIIRHRKSHAN